MRNLAELFGILFYCGVMLPPPAYALLQLRQVFRESSRPLQFGVPELLVLPVLCTPAILLGLRITEVIELLLPLTVAVYQIPFALWHWARQPMTEWRGWRPAASLLSGSLFGIGVLLIWMLVVTVCSLCLSGLFNGFERHFFH